MFSTIDLKNGFFHVSTAKSNRKYILFVVSNGQYEFLRCILDYNIYLFSEVLISYALTSLLKVL